jgi:hypothetical protein
MPLRRWASSSNDITNFDGRSMAQEAADSIGLVPFGGFPQEITQGTYEATRIRWRYGLFVNKNYSAVLSLFFRPGFEQRENLRSWVTNVNPCTAACCRQAESCCPKNSPPPFRQTRNYKQPIATAKTIRDPRRDMLIQKKPEHLSLSLLLWRRFRQPAATCALVPRNLLQHSRIVHPQSLLETPLRS